MPAGHKRGVWEVHHESTDRAALHYAPQKRHEESHDGAQRGVCAVVFPDNRRRQHKSIEGLQEERVWSQLRGNAKLAHSPSEASQELVGGSKEWQTDAASQPDAEWAVSWRAEGIFAMCYWWILSIGSMQSRRKGEAL